MNENESMDTTDTTNTAAILKDIQQRLGFLERKIDTLLNQSSEKSGFQKRHFSKHGRPFGRFNQFDKGGRDERSAEGGFSDSKPRSFHKKKKFYENIPGKFKKRPNREF